MEFVDGRSLTEYLDEVAGLEEQDAVEVAVQVADALEYGHQNGVIHCDVKPGISSLTGGAGRRSWTSA